MTMKLVLPQKISAEAYITIDSGTNIGVAFWDEINKWPVLTETIVGSNKLSWENRIRFIIYTFKTKANLWKEFYKKVYIEKPHFQESGKGLVSARGGQLYKLIKAYVLEQYILEEAGFSVIEVEPYEWKGQLDKLKVHHRLKLILNQEYPDHVADAVAMGLWVKGLFGPKKKD